MINWHRLFGLTLTSLLSGSQYHVELEKELSLKKQFLDIVIVRKYLDAPVIELPVGLEHLAEYNLLTYKSLHESLSAWVIEELIGYYSNYRKIISPSLDKLLPAEQFQLFAICTRYPDKLLRGKIEFQKTHPGVYEIQWGTRIIKLIVLSQIERIERNAFWLLFSGKADKFIFADQHYTWQHDADRALLNQLYEFYKCQGIVMPYTMEDFKRDFTKQHLSLLPPEERLEGLPPEERLRGLPPEERLRGLPPEERLRGLPPEERLRGLSIEEIHAYLAKLKQ